MNASYLISALMRKRDELTGNSAASLKAIVDRLELQPDNIVLDVAVGTGTLLPQITSRLTASGWTDAYDRDPSMLAKASAGYASSGKARFILGDVERDAIFGAYDAIVIFGILPAFENPVATVKRLYDDHLMPGGRIAIAFGCSKEEINSLISTTGENGSTHYLDSAEELAARLTESGMNVAYTLDDDSAYTIILKK